MPFRDDPTIWIKELFKQAGCSNSLSLLLSTVALVVIVVLLSWLISLIVKTIIFKDVTRIIKRTTSTWHDIFLEQKVFTRLSHLVPSLVIWFMAGWALKAYPVWLITVHKLAYVYMIVAGNVVVLNEFGLRVFQQPTGDDRLALLKMK